MIIIYGCLVLLVVVAGLYVTAFVLQTLDNFKLLQDKVNELTNRVNELSKLIKL